MTIKKKNLFHKIKQNRIKQALRTTRAKTENNKNAQKHTKKANTPKHRNTQCKCTRPHQTAKTQKLQVCTPTKTHHDVHGATRCNGKTLKT